MWALGCLLYKLLYRRTPFEDGTGSVSGASVVSCAYTIPDRPARPPEVVQLIRDCLVVRVSPRRASLSF